jgi:hypothetical protein
VGLERLDRPVLEYVLSGVIGDLRVDEDKIKPPTNVPYSCSIC